MFDLAFSMPSLGAIKALLLDPVSFEEILRRDRCGDRGYVLANAIVDAHKQIANSDESMDDILEKLEDLEVDIDHSEPTLGSNSTMWLEAALQVAWGVLCGRVNRPRVNIFLHHIE